MQDWPNYLVFKVRYEEDDGEIDKVLAQEYKGGQMDYAEKIPRDVMINLIKEDDKRFSTAYKDDKSLSKGDEVTIKEVDNQEIITTDISNDEDDLGDLPEF